jgi:hypothetical protein
MDKRTDKTDKNIKVFKGTASSHQGYYKFKIDWPKEWLSKPKPRPLPSWAIDAGTD